MKNSLRARGLLTALALALVGCDPYEPKSEGPPKPEEHAESKLGPPSPEPPVMPSPIPSLPNPNAKASMTPEPKPPEPKVDTPK